jgi:hypothetical protein
LGNVPDSSLPSWWPAPLRKAVTDEEAGATEVARMVVDGLLQLTADRARAVEAAAGVAARLTGYAPVWHAWQAVGSAAPMAALRRIRRELDDAVPKSVSAAQRWIAERGGPVDVAPGSSIVAQVLGSGPRAPDREPVAGLAGADAVSPTEVLNIKGTADLARRLPTLVVTTSLKLVPEAVMTRLAAPLLEKVPLHLFAAVVLDGEILSPHDAGLRAGSREVDSASEPA